MVPPVLVIAAVAYFVVTYILGIKKDEREPPFVSSKIARIGHFLEIMKPKQISHYQTLSKKTREPMYSLSVPRSRIYVATRLDVIADVEKNPETLSFGSYAVDFVARVFGLSQKAVTILKKEDGGHHFFHQLTQVFRRSLASGEQLDAAHQTIIMSIQSALDQLAPMDSGSTELKLLEWLRYEVTIANCRAIWEPENPISSPELVDAFCKGLRGRATCAKAFADYYRTGGYAKTQQLVRDRFDMCRAQGLSMEEIGYLEVTTLWAIVANSVPTALWACYHVFSDPNLLASCRAEIAATGLAPALASQQGCPLLQSAVKEALRLHCAGANERYVKTDTPLLHDKYLLKKGGLVMMPIELLHADTEIWGPDAQDFNPYRFYKHSSGMKSDGSRVSGAAFRAFGSGTTICPGRHLALRETTSLVAMLVAGFDISPLGGQWEVRSGRVNDMDHNIRPPGNVIEIAVTRRE